MIYSQTEQGKQFDAAIKTDCDFRAEVESEIDASFFPLLDHTGYTETICQLCYKVSTEGGEHKSCMDQEQWLSEQF